MTKPLIVLSLIALAVSCTQTPPPPVTPPPDPKAIVRLEVAPNALLLTQQGQKQVLSVKAFNSSGAEIPATVTWTSSRPEQVSASSSGELEAKTALGSSQIVAEVAGVKSAPVLVSIAQPAAGVMLVSDAQVRGTPTLVDPNAEADSDNPYEVLLTGITPPAVGSLLLGREGKAIGGEVISSVSEGDAVRVRLKLVPVTQLMARAQIKETVDFTNLPLQLPPEIVRDYDVTQVDGEYRFTPKIASGAMVRPQAIKEFKLGPYNCEFATPELPISLGQPGQFSLKFNPSLEIDFDPDENLRKLIARAELSAKMKAAIVLSAGGLLNLDCTATLYSKLLPLPGWAGLILAGELKAGIGFEIEGATSFPLGGVEISSETKGTLEMGLDCTAGECRVVRSFSPVNTSDVRFVKPNVANIRPAELFIFGYGFAKIKAGMTLIDKLRMDVVTARAGLKLEGSFAPPSTQLEPSTNALEPDYQSSYKLGLLAEVVAGSVNKVGDSAFRKLLQKLGVFKFNLFKFQTSKPLASSPKGSATQDKKDFKAGDTVNFNVKLDPTTTEFPFVGYNVERVIIMRKVGSSPAEKLATVTANKDQLEFSLPWVADSSSDSSFGSAFYAFVDTALPVPFDLELGRVASSAPPVISEVFSGTVRLNGSFQNARNSTETSPGESFGSFSETFNTALTATVQFNPINPSANRIISKNATVNMTESRETFSRVTTLDPPPCTIRERSGSTITTTGSSTTPVFGDGGLIRFTGTAYTIEIVGIVGDAREQGEARFFFVPVQTPCTLPPPRVVPINRGATQISYLPFGERPSGSGEVIVNPDGSKSIAGTRTVTESGAVPPSVPNQTNTRSVNYTLTWDLRTPPVVNTATPVDLELDIIAPVSAAPEGKLTYAVNLRNKSQTAASNLRAEFFLPEGFTMLDTQGWSGCTTILTTVTCAASRLEAGERRAFLIDVQAPASGGEYIVSARVSSLERDLVMSDNFDTGATLILEP